MENLFWNLIFREIGRNTNFKDSYIFDGIYFRLPHFCIFGNDLLRCNFVQVASFSKGYRLQGVGRWSLWKIGQGRIRNLLNCIFAVQCRILFNVHWSNCIIEIVPRYMILVVNDYFWCASNLNCIFSSNEFSKTFLTHCRVLC